MLTVIPLGTAGFIPSITGRETCSALAISGETAILFDAGTGVRHLADAGVAAALEPATALHVVFSHFHNDHVAGLTWLLRLWPKRLVLHTPTQPLLDSDGAEAVTRLCAEPYFSKPLREWPQKPTVSAFADDVIDAGGVRIAALKQTHDGGSVGYRVGDFAYISDVDPRDEHVAFVQGCRLMLIDTMHDRHDYAAATSGGTKRGQHGSSTTSAHLALAARVQEIGLIHLDPLYDATRLAGLLRETRETFPETSIPDEGSRYVLPSAGPNGSS
jgi:ribonuclease BN (tRNA processing enzyme)